MNLSEYMDPARFPWTTKVGLSPEEQLAIDAFNYAQVQEYLDRGNAMNAAQKAYWAELDEKIRNQWPLLEELRRAQALAKTAPLHQLKLVADGESAEAD
jgi:hypothetical protein